MFLSAPKYAVWLISTILMVLVIAIKFFGVGGLIPVVGPMIASNLFYVTLLAYFLLWAGTVLKGF